MKKPFVEIMRRYWPCKSAEVRFRTPYIKFFHRRKGWVGVVEYQKFRTRILVLADRMKDKDARRPASHSRQHYLYDVIEHTDILPGEKAEAFLWKRMAWKKVSVWQLARIRHTWPK